VTSLLLIGTGNMGIEYARILTHLDIPFKAVGRSRKKVEEFENKTKKTALSGGIENNRDLLKENIEHCIVAVSGNELGRVTELLVKNNVEKILVEKPGGSSYEEIIRINQISKKYKSKVYIGYNRRFYNSVIKAKQLIQKDNNVKSFHFDFTEWSHKIIKIPKPEIIKSNWLLHNSTHVIDLAFYLGGEPIKFNSFSAGKLPWHEKSIYTGAGITDKNALFSYHANWEAPGRWGLEIMTEKHKIKLQPLEKIFVKQLNDLEYKEITITNKDDYKFKPGMLKQVYAFRNDEFNSFITLEKQANRIKIYKNM
jgi:predicted dehydrogenase